MTNPAPQFSNRTRTSSENNRKPRRKETRSDQSSERRTESRNFRELFDELYPPTGNVVRTNARETIDLILAECGVHSGMDDGLIARRFANSITPGYRGSQLVQTRVYRQHGQRMIAFTVTPCEGCSQEEYHLPCTFLRNLASEPTQQSTQPVASVQELLVS